MRREARCARRLAKDIPATCVLYPDEGHGFACPENRLSFNAVTKAFLAAHLGGRFEPVGDDFKGSTLQVPEGVEQVPGLADALTAHTKPAVSSAVWPPTA